MGKKWINRITFWTLCIVPFVSIILMSKSMGPAFFCAGLMLYIFLYRPFVHINRLLQLGAIDEKDAWRLFVPFYSARFTKTMWLS